MSHDTYIRYLEALVLSLLAERNSDNDIVSVDITHPSWKPPGTFSVYNVRKELTEQRKSRGINVGRIEM